MIDQDDDLYGRVRAEFEPVRMAGDLDAVTARGGELRRRRRVALPAGACLAVAGLAAVLNLPAALGLPAVPGPPAGSTPPSITLAAWSVEAEPDGTITLTVRELVDADGLAARLEQAGVPARVDFLPPGEQCAGEREGLPAIAQVVRMGGGEPVAHIRPAAMPAGTILRFIASGTAMRFSLVEGEPPKC